MVLTTAIAAMVVMAPSLAGSIQLVRANSDPAPVSVEPPWRIPVPRSTPSPVGQPAASAARPAAPTPHAATVAATTPVLAPTPRPAGAAVRVRDDGTILVNDRPFFPFGFYVWDDYDLRDITTIARGGFNTVHALSSLWEGDAFRAYLDHAAAIGMRVDVEIDQANIAGEVDRYRHKPAVLSWNILDDCTGDPDEMRRARAASATAQRIDPSHPTTTVCAGSADLTRELFQEATIGGIEQYGAQTPDGASSTVMGVGMMRDQFVAHGGTAFCVCQSYPNPIDPTPEQVRYQTWAAIAAGAKGILYYSFHDPTSLDARNPQLWEEYKALAAELTPLFPMLLDGQYRAIVRTRGLTIATWTLGDQTLLVVANGEGAQRSVDLTIDGRIAGAPSDRHNSLHYERGHMTGALPPYGVAVYLIRGD